MILRRALIKFQNDATACFDRILNHLAQLNNRSFGLPAEIAEIVGMFLFEAMYFIKTGMGVSATGYKHTQTSFVGGTGQGSTSAYHLPCHGTPWLPSTMNKSKPAPEDVDPTLR